MRLLRRRTPLFWAGIFAWGINLAEAKGDFALIDSLPGKKIILKGNHDLWWETASKMHRFLDENGFTTSYGSFFDDHDVKVQVFPYDKEGDESSYLVNDTIKAGDVRAVERYSKERENETDRQILETLRGMSAGSSYTDAGDREPCSLTL